MAKREDILKFWTEILRVQHASTTKLESALSAKGLSLSTYEILYRLSGVPGRRMRMQVLAESVLLSPSGLSRAVTRGELMGLLARESDDGDERARICSLTPSGLSKLAELQPLFFDTLNHLFASKLTTSELNTTTDLLRRLTDER